MSDLEADLVKQQATLALSQEQAALTLSVPNPAHTAAENDVLLRKQNIDLIERELEPSSIPPRSRVRIYQPQLANNPSVLITGSPNPRGIPANATLINNSYYLTPDGTVIPKI